MRTITYGNRNHIVLISAALLFTTAISAYALSKNAGTDIDVASVLLALVVILAAAKLGGDIFVRLGQPAVLGELVLGMLIGNLTLVHIHSLEFIKHDPSVDILAEIGVILLLFQVGLESDLAKMVKVGTSSLLVATLGVIVPFFLGWATATFFLHNESIYVHIFIGATLCATSVGITARVFRDLGRVQTPEARIVLGAAVIDDVQGLIILAVVTGIIAAIGKGAHSISSVAVLVIVLKATLFLAGAIFIGRWIAPRVFHITSKLKTADLLLTTTLGICFIFAYSAKTIGLAPIVGAFAAGLILDEIHWSSFKEREEQSVEDLIKPLAGFLVPVFFVLMGARVDLSTFARLNVLGLAGVLTLAAILGKQVCGLGVLQKGLDKLSIGIGMIPRGEVGLIFAAIGSKLMLNGKPVIQDAVYSAIVIMVVVTTMITPPALKWSLNRRRNN